MRRKQLFMIALTGALVTGTVPGTVWAAESGVEATSEEGAPAVDDAGEDTSEEPSQDATEAPTEAPSQDVTEAPAEEPSQDPAEPAADSQNGASEEEQPVAEETQEESGDTQETDQTVAIGDQKFATLADAVAYAKANPAEDGKSQIITLSASQEISGTITVDGTCKVSIVAAADDVKITRAEGFTGNLFAVSGEDAVLQLNKAEDGTETKSLTIDGTTTATEGVKSLIAVSDSATFEMYTGVTLTGNKTTDEGGAITNKKGLVSLGGGTVTGNTGAKGGVYSDVSVSVMSDIQVTGNKGADDKDANLYLDGSKNTMKVMGELADSAKLAFSLSNPPAKEGDSVTVAEIGKDADDKDAVDADKFKAAVSKMTYDGASDKFEAVAVASDNKTAVLKMKKTQTDPEKPKAGTGEVGVPKYDSSTKSVTFNIKGTEKFNYYVAAFPIGSKEADVKAKFDKKKATNKAEANTKTSVTFKNYDKTTDLWVYFEWPDGSVSCEKEVLFLPTISGVTWTDHNTVQFKLAANHPFHYYYTVTEKAISSKEAKAAYKESKAKTKVSANEKAQLTIKKVPEGSDFQVWVYFKMNDGTMKYSRIPLSLDKRPGKSDNTRDPKTHTVGDCKISGLKDPLKFYPGVFYEFSVTGAGEEIENPVTGDEKYVPLYWSTSKTPTDAQKNKSWKIGSAKGITSASAYNMYVFFQKYRYNGAEWIAVGDPEYKTEKFQAAEITDDDLNNWKKENGVTGTPGDGSDGSGSGGGTDAELTATAAAQDSSSSSRSAVSTADESPIGSMSALMALSLLAGGYVLVRKRKKEN